MHEPALLLAAFTGLIAWMVLSGVLLAGWRGWLALKRTELEGGPAPRPAPPRRDIADLRERVRRLEAIASGSDY